MGSQGGCTFEKYGKGHTGVCRSGGACRKYGREGHYARDCRQSAPVQDLRILYHFHQVGHLRANCPQLVARPVQASAPTHLWITGGDQGGAEPPRTQGRAFQLIAEEVRAKPDAIAGMFSFHCCLVIWLFM